MAARREEAGTSTRRDPRGRGRGREPAFIPGSSRSPRPEHRLGLKEAASAAAVVDAAAAGAGPSSAAPASPAAAAAAGGVSAGSVFVKRSDDARARFAPVKIFVGDAVGHLVKRASLERGWGVDAAYVDLFLVPVDAEDAVAAGEDGAEARVLAAPPLSSIRALAAVGVRDASCLLARVAGPLAAAAGECALAAHALPLSRYFAREPTGQGLGPVVWAAHISFPLHSCLCRWRWQRVGRGRRSFSGWVRALRPSRGRECFRAHTRAHPLTLSRTIPPPPLLPLPAEKFWRYLASARFDASSFSLTLAHETDWLGIPGGGSVMFVRPCYSVLAAAVQQSPFFSLVRGTPGVGKSMFGLYFAWTHMQQLSAGAVVYDYVVEQTQKLRVIVKGGAARVVVPSPLEPLLDSSSTLYIADGTPPSPSTCRTLVVTSPKRGVYKEWLKERAGVAELYVPPFTAVEMELCRLLCFPSISSSAVARLFDTWGGSARLVLKNHEKSRSSGYMAHFRSTLQFDVLERAVRELFAGGTETAGDVPHLVLHIVADEGLRSFHLEFASLFACDAFYEAMESAGEDRVRRFIAAAESEPAMGSLRGLLFERVALAALCRNGDVTCYPLSAAGRGDVMRRHLTGRAALIFGGVNDVAQLSAELTRRQGEGAPSPLCRPRASNFPTWDACAVEDGVLTLYQVTVSDLHDVKAAGLQLATPLLTLATGPVRFVFVVPPGRGPQTEVAPSGALPSWVRERRLEQSVIELPTAPPRRPFNDALSQAAAMDVGMLG